MQHVNRYRDDDYPDDEADTGPSKTQVKAAMHELQDLGVELLKLNAAQLDAIEMDPRLRDALREAGRMPTREAKRRHMQYVGKLLRDTDSEPARRALLAIRSGDARLLADAERWREQLLAGDAALTDWIKAHPQTELQPLRTLIRNARREIAALEAAEPDAPAARGKSRAFRELFQKLRVLLQQSAAAASQR
jgi:ribosome-associated protein